MNIHIVQNRRRWEPRPGRRDGIPSSLPQLPVCPARYRPSGPARRSASRYPGNTRSTRPAAACSRGTYPTGSAGPVPAPAPDGGGRHGGKYGNEHDAGGRYRLGMVPAGRYGCPAGCTGSFVTDGFSGQSRLTLHVYLLQQGRVAGQHADNAQTVRPRYGSVPLRRTGGGNEPPGVQCVFHGRAGTG